MSTEASSIVTGSDTFPTTGGLTLFEQWWYPDGDPRAVFAIVHGYAEHSGRYDWTGRQLAARGYAVDALDLRGHGRSTGERVMVNSYTDYHDDVDRFLDRVRLRHPGKKVFLFGHSMGGGVVASYVVAKKPALAGFVICGAGIAPQRPASAAARPAAAAAPRPLPADTISRDPAVVAAYENDPLVFRGIAPAGRAAAFGASRELVQNGIGEVKLPLLVLHGTADKLANYRGGVELYARIGSPDRTLRLYDGLYHEVLNEPEKDTVMADLLEWLDARS
ncbi:MAG TPA: lysophospholipase [Tepidiformaceae bacterium]